MNLTTKSSSLIYNIKVYLKTKNGIPFQIELLFKNTLMKDMEKIKNYGIIDNSIIKIEPIDNNIIIKYHEKKEQKILMHLKKSVEDLKTEITNEINFPLFPKEEQRLFYKGKELDDNKKPIINYINERDVKLKNVEFDLYIGTKNGILIEVNSKIYQCLKYSFSPNSKIQTIKEKIYEYTLFPPEIQNLSYFNSYFNINLDNYKSLSDYNIKNKSSFNLNLKSKNGIIILIKRPAQGIMIPLDISLNSTIFDIGKMIEEKCKLPLQNMKLTYNNNYLNNFSLSILNYGIKHESIIEAEFYSDSGFTIFIKNFHLKTRQIQVKSNYTIENIKELVYFMEGIPLNESLIFAGKQLENERTLEYYKIQEGSTLHYALRLRGG